MEIIRATRTAQQAAAYYVRIQAMARKHRIPLDVEFDETGRLYGLDAQRVMLGRIVVLPEYRHQGLGTLVVEEAEKWAREMGYTTAVLESRDNKIPFYERLGYVADMRMPIVGETFTCYRMEKPL